jgi:hypothetical protein
MVSKREGKQDLEWLVVRAAQPVVPDTETEENEEPENGKRKVGKKSNSKNDAKKKAKNGNDDENMDVDVEDEGLEEYLAQDSIGDTTVSM